MLKSNWWLADAEVNVQGEEVQNLLRFGMRKKHGIDDSRARGSSKGLVESNDRIVKKMFSNYGEYFISI